MKSKADTISVSGDDNIFYFQDLAHAGKDFRSLEEIFMFFEDHIRRGSRVIIRNEDIDTDQPAKEFLSLVIKAFKAYRREQKSTHVKRGIEEARRRGKKIGRPMLRNDRQIKVLRDQGFSIRAISSELQISTWAVRLGLRSAGPN